MRRRLTGLVLAFLMIFGLMPHMSTTALADETLPKITIEMGAGHEEAAKKYAAYLNDAGNGRADCEAEVSGTKVSFYYTRSIIENYAGYDPAKEELTARTAYAQSAVSDIGWDALPGDLKAGYNYIENGEMILSAFARNSADYYMDGKSDEINWEGSAKSDATLLPKEQTFYAFWRKPINECSISIEPPVCGEENGGEMLKNTNPPKVTINGEHYGIFEGDDFYSANWLKKGADGSYEYEVYEGTFEGGEVYGADIWLEADFGYYFTKDVKVTVAGADYQTAEELNPVASGKSNPSISGYFIKANLNVTAVHDWSDWTMVKEPTEDEEGLEERVCLSDPSHKETRQVDKPYSVGIELDTDHIEWTAEEGYKGATEDGIESDAIHKEIKATSVGSDKVEFVIAGFKDNKSYEQFTVSAGEMEVTVAPKEGLAPGTYTAVVLIGDYYERLDDIEVPVTFTVTEKQSSAGSEEKSEDKTPKDKKSDNNGESKTDSKSASGSDKSIKRNAADTNTVRLEPATSRTEEKAAAKSAVTGAPKTGDKSNIYLWSIVIFAAISVSAILTYRRRKTR